MHLRKFFTKCKVMFRIRLFVDFIPGFRFSGLEYSFIDDERGGKKCLQNFNAFDIVYKAKKTFTATKNTIAIFDALRLLAFKCPTDIGGNEEQNNKQWLVHTNIFFARKLNQIKKSD